MIVRRTLLLLLCAALAIGAPLAGAFAAGQPCASAGASPCDCEAAATSACALACGVAFSAPASAPMMADFFVVAGRVLGAAPAHFASIAGPPGLQPPR